MTMSESDGAYHHDGSSDELPIRTGQFQSQGAADQPPRKGVDTEPRQHADAPLPFVIRAGGEQARVLRTLDDACAFLRDRRETGDRARALEEAAACVAEGVRTGAPADVAHAASRVQDYVRLIRGD